MQVDERYLRDRYSKMNDEDLARIFKEEGLTEEAEKILKEELIKRKINIPTDEEINSCGINKNKNIDGFASGKLWILMAIIGFLVSSGRFLYYINSLPILSIFFFLYGLLCITSAIGLIKRRKIGLYATYSLLVIATFGFIVESLVLENLLTVVLIKIIGVSIISYLWFSYFRKRESWFK